MRKFLFVIGALALLACFACAKKAEAPEGVSKETTPTTAPELKKMEKGAGDAAGMPAEAEAPPPPAPGGGADLTAIPKGDASALVGELKLIKTANVTLEVPNVDEGFEKVYAVAAAEKAIVTGTNRSVAEEGYAYGSVTVKVTPEKYDETLRAMRKLGRLVDENSSSQDVTAEYVDLQARLENAEASRARYLQILAAKSATVPDILAVEREIERVTETIERLKGELRVMESQVSLSTVTVTLEEPHAAIPGGYRFTKAVKSAVRIAIYICIFLVQAIIVLLPFVVILLILLLILRAILWYFQRRKRKVKETAAGRA